MSLPATVDELYPSEWLRASDLNGRAVTLTIAAVKLERFPYSREPDELKAVIDFGRSKRLICNKTQCHAIAEISGSPAFADWPLTKIVLAPGMTPNRKPTIIISAPHPEHQVTEDPNE